MEISDITLASESTTSDPPPALPGVRLARRIGAGAYGEVWLGWNEVTARLIAAKIIPVLNPGDARAERELAALKRLESGCRGRHEHLIDIHHVGKTDSYLYYWMDAADDISGEAASLGTSYRPATLHAVLERGAVDITAILRWGEHLLAGLAFLHHQGLTHRDVKPANCMFFAGKLKLGDFGLITHAHSTASLIGTPAYMPPDGCMDHRADVYAMGLVLYQMFTGLGADSFPRPSAQMVRHCRDPRAIGLNLLILRACDPTPQKRFADAGQMLEALQNMSHRPLGRRWWPAILLIGLIITASIIILRHWPNRNVPKPLAPTDVNFITNPFEAEVYIDGIPVVDAFGHAVRTPCTIHRLTASPHHVAFRIADKRELDAGTIDFSEKKEVTASWQSP